MCRTERALSSVGIAKDGVTAAIAGAMAMKVAGILGVMAMVGLPAQHVMCDEANGMVVRIALLEIDPAQLVAYQHAVKEEITESIRKSAPLFRDLCQRRRLPKPH